MKTFIVDSFTNESFKGNPAGVCFPENEISEKQMLQVAMELGLSETAFVKHTNKAAVYAIRYFSPKKEIPLCGHATLAAAKVLFKNASVNEIHFTTIEGLDLVIQQNDEAITMEFPVYDTVAATAPAAMLEALGITVAVNAAYSEKNKIIMIEISDSAILANLNPDFNALINSHDAINGVLVTAPSKNADYDYHYRYFWPWAGTNEDPVTGGVQTFLAKYWSERLHKKNMKAFQSSARTGYMDIVLRDDKVLLTSNAVIMLEGNFSSI
jgi:PhzF family phenazine biosynthesis protein